MADFKADGCILTGSLTEAAAGVPFIDAGTNITTAINANGSITINATGGGSAADVGWTGPADGQIATTGSLYVGQSGVGSDVIFYGEDASAVGLQWDADYAEHGALLLGANNHGVDLVIRGETANHFLHWDQNLDKLNLAGHFTFNDGALDLDFRAESQNIKGMIVIDSGTDQLLLHASGTTAATAGGTGFQAGSDVATYISGAVGSVGVVGSKGVTLVAGDLVTSGNLQVEGDISSTSSPATAINIGTAGVVFNEDGNAANDFRVESDTETHALFIDASENELHINQGKTAFTTHVCNATEEVMRITGVGAIFNETGNTNIDFRVESDNEQQALFIDSSEDELHINKGETAFTTIIASINDEAIRVDAAGVVFNEDGHATNDFRVETDIISHALFVDAGANTVTISNASDQVMKVDATGVVFNEDSHATNDFRVETNTEANALFIDSGADTITTSVPLLNKDKPRLSKYITAGTWAASTGNENIFSNASWTVNPTYASSLTATYISHATANGKFTVTYAATYCVIVPLLLKASSNGDFTFRGYVNSVLKYEMQGSYVHAAVDPVERTFSFLLDCTAGAVLEFYIEDTAGFVAVAYATVNIYAI